MAGEDPVRDDDGAPRPEDGPPPDDAPGEAAGNTASRVPGPAPVIDLGGDAVPVRPVKPLGPRRLARLQRELAERERELSGTTAPSADPELLEKQRRFTELAARAAAANEQTPEEQAGAEQAPEEQAAEQVAAEQAAAEQPGAEHAGRAPAAEQITVVFPDAPGTTAGPDEHDPVHVDPALFGHHLAPGGPASATHIEIVPAGGPGSAGSHAAAPPAKDAATEPAGAADAGAAEATAVDAGAPAPAPVTEGPGAPAPGAFAGVDAEDVEPPAAPVPAVSAEGLELPPPREYRRRNPWLPVLLAAVLAALVVVLVIFVL